MGKALKPLHWIGSSLDDLKELPDEMQDVFGYALQRAQEGAQHGKAKPLKGFGGGSVLEILEKHEGNAYRAVYTVMFPLAIYVLHVFQKKSKKGIATPLSELRLIKKRLQVAAQDYATEYPR